MEKLKPCPFCGKEALTYKRVNIVGCNEPTCVAHGLEASSEEWNHRVPEGRDAVLEEAAKLCDELARDDCSAGYAGERIRELKGAPQEETP